MHTGKLRSWGASEASVDAARAGEQEPSQTFLEELLGGRFHGEPMDRHIGHQVHAAEVVLPCQELSGTLGFFMERLGFRLEVISPADDPSMAVISGHGLRIRLERGPGAPGVLRLSYRDLQRDEEELIAPNGTRIVLARAEPPLVLPPAKPSFVVSRLGEGAVWKQGRAGMAYRDLIPGRQGGRYGASHIRIEEGGPVPDYVHFHQVAFQMIYCYRGWVELVYEDQGPAFVLREGDCVLQPPEIRHRVLECSSGLEVIEVSSPAEHPTFAEHDMALPTESVWSERDFRGQRFVRHEAARARWSPGRLTGFESRDLGIAAATRGLAGARVARRSGPTEDTPSSHDAELLFVFVLKGAVALAFEERATERLASGDSFVLPAKMSHALVDCSVDLELLELSFPAAFATQRQIRAR
jgi:quercetin dioxygenase-like cupin family protein